MKLKPSIEPIALSADEVVKCLFPSMSVNYWRNMDSDGCTPAAFSTSERKKLWLVDDLRLWAALGYPKRPKFEREKKRLDSLAR